MEAEQSYDCMFKLLVIGDTGVGKSSLTLRFTKDSFPEEHVTTLGIDFSHRIISLDSKRIKLQLWDTAGQEKFHSIVTAFFRGAAGAIITYDITNMESFNHAKDEWLKEAKRWCLREEIAVVLVGNKCDLLDQREVPRSLAQEFANETGMQSFEVSAKDSVGVERAFVALAQECMKNMQRENLTYANNPSRPNDRPTGSTTCCLVS